MPGSCLDIVRISRYVQRSAELEDNLQVERHVRDCSKCRQKLLSMKRYSEALFDDYCAVNADASRDCPSRILLHHYERENLAERQMLRLQEHLRTCADCAGRVMRHAEWRSMEGFALEPRQSMLALHATRTADLDLRFAAVGLGIARGAELVDREGGADLSRRLGLQGLRPHSSRVSSERTLHFSLPGVDGMQGSVQVLSPEGFRLGLRFPEAIGAEMSELVLWSRTHIWLRQAPQAGRWVIGSILPPGHYFIGPTEFSPPWLAVSVEEDLLTPLQLIELGYDHCLWGRFHSAVHCFVSACAQEAGCRAFRQLRDTVREFAVQEGLQDRDRSLVWLEDGGAGPEPEPAEPPQLDLCTFSLNDLDDLADLIRHLDQQVDARQPMIRPEQVKRLSRRHFRSRFERMMRRALRILESLECLRTDPASVA